MPIPQLTYKPALWGLTSLVLILVTSFDYFVEDYFLQKEINQQRSETHNQLTMLRTQIEGVLNSNILLVQGLASVIATKPDIDQEYFARICKDIIKNSNIIRNVAGAPDLIIRLMYPMQGNQAAIGLDYRLHPQQKTAALKVIETGKLVLAGPLELQQGGTGFVARIPVYIAKSVSGEKNQLWGLLSSVFDTEKFYSQAGLEQNTLNIRVAIKGRDAEGSKGDHFYGDRNIYQQSPVRENINLPYGSWQVYATPQHGWLTQSTNVWLIRLVNLLLALLLISIIIITSFNQLKQKHLKEGLKSSNYRFTSVLDGMNAVVYVTDMQTHEILYANPKALDTYGDNLIGDKCWNRFQANQSQACEFCINNELLDDLDNIKPPISHEIQSSYNDIWYHCETQAIPWDDGRIARLEVGTDISELKRNEQLLSEAHKNLETTAYYDPLTGLPNRRMLTTHFNQIVTSKAGSNQQLIICYLDLDGFKEVNDSYGHEVGDHLLTMIANRLNSTIRENDTVARWGGDEFALLLRVHNMQEATDLLNRILTRVTESYSFKEYKLKISASIGVAVYSDSERDIDTLLRQADQAMYSAKQQGKQQFCFFDADEDRKLHAKQEQVNEISRAISDNEMVLYFQPKISLQQARVYGAEVLIRWSHPTRGIVQPLDFLPYIRGSDTQIELDWWVIETAINQALQWQRHHVNLSVSINVSPITLQQDNFIAQLLSVLNHRQLKPGAIELEILESDVADIDKIIDVIEKLKEFNLSFALDDYGTGYSSLTYLRKLPVDTIKIDQSFVRDMLIDQDDLNIVEGVIGLARVFGREVIAEGVETIEHGIKLAALDCTNLQGYGIARPMPLEQFNDWLSKYEIPQQWIV
jgi:diguanylate cyclase (GGDEF)-like protein